MSIHDGHRSRVRERFLKEGLDNFQPHEVLEFLLFYSNPRCNTNVIAHNLLNKFGTLARVFDAPISELTKVDGVGQISAVLIKMIPQISRRYMISLENDTNEELFNDAEKARQYLVPYFIGKTTEHVYLVAIDNMSRPIECALINEGTINMAEVDIRKMLEFVMSTNASYIMLAHNHPNGYAIPSREDLAMTEQVSMIFGAIGIQLIDHLIVVNDTVVSLLENGYIEHRNGLLKAVYSELDEDHVRSTIHRKPKKERKQTVRKR